MCHNVWKGGDNLLFRREIGALLEFKVADGSREREISINASKIDEATSGTDASLFAFIMGERMPVFSSLERNGSPSFCGLWSNDKGFALPLTPRTDRESPAFACNCET